MIGKIKKLINNPEYAFIILCIINILSFIDRGIIAGSSLLIMGCVSSEDKCKHVPKIISCNGEETLPCDQCRICGTECKDDTIDQTGFGIDSERLGVLQSSFMIGYCLASIAFGNLVHRFKPFHLVAFGLCLWLFAVVFSGISGFTCDHDYEKYVDKDGGQMMCKGYWLMLLSRMLSGVGEAALACIAIPFLDDVLPSEKKGRYLGIYFASIPVGTALGFVWSGLLSSAVGRWEYAFIFEAPVMAPFMMICWLFPFKLRVRDHKHPADGNEGIDDDNDGTRAPHPPQPSSNIAIQDAPSISTSTTESDHLQERLITDEDIDNNNSSNDDDEHDINGNGNDNYETIDHFRRPASEDTVVNERITLFDDIYACLSSPVFLLTSFGYACFTYTSAGLAFYTPTFIQNYRPCDDNWRFDQQKADLIFGAIVIFAGSVGTYTGGIILDHRKKISQLLHLPYQGDDIVTHALQLASLESLAATLLCCSVFFITNPYAFFVLYAVAVTLSFLTTSPSNLAILGSVPVKNRSMSMALSLVIIHCFGDVPSPIIIGMIADKHSPLFTLGTTLINLALATLLWMLTFTVSTRLRKGFRDDDAPIEGNGAH